MPKKLFALLLAALMVCGAALALADGIAVTDMHGREITLDAARDAHCRAHAVRL